MKYDISEAPSLWDSKMSAHVLALLLLIGTAVAESLGVPSSIEEFPSQAQVEFYEGGSWLQRCAGSIITNKHVLSVATCFDGSSLSYRRLRVGDSIRGSGEIFLVKEVINHPDFGLLGYDADIAIVELEEYLTLGDTIRQAPILGQGIELPGGLRVVLAAWGTTAEGGKESSDDLFSISLSVTDGMECLIKYIQDTFVTENMICVGLTYYTGRDFDFSDKGGALFYEDTLVGLLTYGASAADNQYPVLATSVGAYADWIITTAAS